jgi:hypothetical protein
MHVGGIFCDLAKGFDCVNHDILLANQWTVANWFTSYLTDRKQKTEIFLKWE